MPRGVKRRFKSYITNMIGLCEFGSYDGEAGEIDYAILTDDHVVCSGGGDVIMFDIKTKKEVKRFTHEQFRLQMGYVGDTPYTCRRLLNRDEYNTSAFTVFSDDGSVTYIDGREIKSHGIHHIDWGECLIVYNSKIYTISGYHDISSLASVKYEHIAYTRAARELESSASSHRIDGITKYLDDPDEVPIVCASQYGVFMLSTDRESIVIFPNGTEKYNLIKFGVHELLETPDSIITIDDKIYGVTDCRNLFILSMSSGRENTPIYINADITRTIAKFNHNIIAHTESYPRILYLFDIRTFRTECIIKYKSGSVVNMSSLNENILLKTHCGDAILVL